MDIKTHISNFREKGFSIVPIQRTDKFIESRTFIADCIREKFNCNGTDDEILNNCHRFIEEISEVKVNLLIMEIISAFKEKYKMDEIIYSCTKSFINKLIGNDIASQKNPNIVFQHPGSSRISELHRDAPGNSFYELVSWVPLVNCYESKSFYILDKKSSRKLLEKYKNNKYKSWSEYTNEAMKLSINLKIDYGNALFFWSGLLHGSVINQTNESRWSFNVRYKNLFAPSGLKDPLVFYRVFSKSPLTELGIDNKYL